MVKAKLLNDGYEGFHTRCATLIAFRCGAVETEYLEFTVSFSR